MATSKHQDRRATGKSKVASDPDAYDEDEVIPPARPFVAVLILAAGSSSRMGESKQLLVINDEPLLARATKAALASGAQNVTVVLGANEQAHLAIIRDLGVDTVSNHFWKSGMGSSIKTGMNALLKKHPETDAVVIMVCDQPAVNAGHLKALIEQRLRKRSPIIASSYADTVGVPALFARPFFSNILILKDDQGAKKIIQQFRQQVHVIDFPDGKFDLDTTEDVQRFLGRP